MASKLALLIDEQKRIESEVEKLGKGTLGNSKHTVNNRKISELKLQLKAIIGKLTHFGSRHDVVIATFRLPGNAYRTKLHFTGESEYDIKMYIEGIFKRANIEIRGLEVETIKPGFDWSLIT